MDKWIKFHDLWPELAIVSLFFLMGHIFLGHFEERSPKLRKLGKFIITLLIVCSLSIWVSRLVGFAVLGISLIPVIYIHAILLPRKGINGWTGEPRSRYYEFRGWNKNIFGEGEADKLGSGTKKN